MRSARRPRPRSAAAFLLLLLCSSSAFAQMTPEQQADLLLGTARRAYNEKNYPFAAERFREFLAKFGGHKEVPSARYGLALALLDGPEKNYQGAIEQLNHLAGMKDRPEHPTALYYLGLSHRGLGLNELAQAAARPPEAPQRRQAAAGRFDEAAKHFAAALAAFAARVPNPPADAREVPADLEWAARSRCELAEMQLRTSKAKEARATAEPFTKEPPLAKSRYRNQGLYYHGFACFLLQDHLAAGRSLNQLTPFTDPGFGNHARYLLARVHHEGGERAEAATHYEGVLADHAKEKQAAAEALKQPDRFKNDPEEKARLEALVRDPPPDHVARATFNLGVMLYEDGKFADALAKLTAFAQQFPKSTLLLEAQLRQGFCQVQLRDFANALKTLQPVADKEPRLADQALLWIGKAQAGLADPNNAQAYDQALRTAIDTLRRAAERAQQLSGQDPQAKGRKGEILLEMADTQQLAKQYREAANTCGQILNEKLVPQRDEEVVQRQATALHLAGAYPESDQVCQRFQQTYPKSTLLPAVLFRYAENAAFTARAAEKNPNLPNRVAELARLNDEAAKRYQVAIDKFPEFAYTNLARYGLAQAHYRKGDLEKAREILEAIPAPERNGELAAVSYLLADCLLRTAPEQADDALAAGRLDEQLRMAVELLEGFAGGQPNGPHTADALLKLGHCYQRQAGLLAQPAERAKVLASARATYERLMQQFPQHALLPNAVFERARCLAEAGDPNGAINELRRFTQDPLRAAPVAPMALVQLATLLRGQNKAAEAADLLAQGRPLHEPKLQGQPARVGWIALLRYHHGVALQEAGKLPEARAVFDQVVKGSADRPEAAEAAMRFGQCLKDEGLQKVTAATQKLATPNLKPEETAAATKVLEEGLKSLRDAVQFLEQQAEGWKQRQPVLEARARMHYDAAWCCRTVAEHEVAGVRARLQEERLKKLREEVAKKTPPGAPPPVLPTPDVPLKDVPLQPAEQKARQHYQALITAFADLPLAGEARLELAELLAERAELDNAVKLLRETLDKEPPPELTDKVRVRLGACLAAKGDTAAALAQFAAVAQNPKSPLAGQAQYRAGECQMAQGQWAEAVKLLAVFRDQPPFQNLPGLTDRALLRLGHAYAQLNQWDASRQAHEQVVARFGTSPWVHEARYGIGWAWQNLKQFDHAVGAYQQVAASTATEIGAKGQLQIGLCRLEQKRFAEASSALLVVPFTYDYPELNAVALSEAARAFAEMKQHEQATRLLRRVIKDHPDSKWAEAAKERLQTLEKS